MQESRGRQEREISAFKNINSIRCPEASHWKPNSPHPNSNRFTIRFTTSSGESAELSILK